MRNLALLGAMLLFISPVILSSQAVEPYDIMISELMIDPNPVVGLPNFEWIEFYNRTDQMINLEGFLYSSGTTRFKLPAYELPAGNYVMLCDDSDVDELISYGQAIAIKTFPSLTNSGDAATLEDPDGNLVHEILYTKSWYGDSDKDDGGYTLELINPNDPCLAASNWIASSSETGGTPSAQNSNWSPSEPVSGIIAKNVATTSSGMEIQVLFNRIPSESLSELDFTISPSIGILDIMPVDNDARAISLVLSEVLDFSTVYTLTISAGVSDCAGLFSGTEQLLDFVLPETPEVGDLVINEILFNPIGAESDYIEMYNASNKFIDIQELMIGNLDATGAGSTREIEQPYILAPMDYLVFTEDVASLLARYPLAINSRVLEVDLPSFNNTDGNITLFIEENGLVLIIDAVNYDEGMHNPSIDDAEGVALERIDTDRPSSDRLNWHSGAASTGFGSPTLPNNQSVGIADSDEIVYLAGKTFFPEQQTDDQLRIVFGLNRSDYIGTLDVYDGVGRFVYQLANNQLIGRNDLYLWDGRNEEGILMNAGIYIIVAQLVASTGEIAIKKLPCVLSRRL